MTTTNNEKLFFCTRPRLLYILVDNGYQPIDTVPNLFRPEYKTWIFERTEELNQIVDDFYSNLEK